jgi:hypothetical protein
MTDPTMYADIVFYNARDIPALQVSLVSAGINIVHWGRSHVRICTHTTETWEWAQVHYQPNAMIKAFDVVTLPTH